MRIKCPVQPSKNIRSEKLSETAEFQKRTENGLSEAAYYNPDFCSLKYVL
jgi:hypothetical protein